MIMLCDEEENCNLFEDEDDKLLTDEDILLVMLEDCSRTSDPTHLQYPQFVGAILTNVHTCLCGF